MLSAIILFAACSGGDAYAPDGSPADVPESGIYNWRPRESTPVVVNINPSSVTLETNQLIRFRANGLNRAGDTVAAPVVWSTTGGTILPDGRFSSAAVGTYRVTGRAHTPGDDPVVDTSIVTVVRRQIVLSLEITPGNATMTPGVNQTFSALGRLKDGSQVQIGALWSATGGTIDAGGVYVAGDTAGTYRVIATNTTGRVADTATITIGAPPSPPPPTDSVPTPPIIPVQPPAPSVPPITLEPPPAPTLAMVTLIPASATLAPASTRQFTAYGRTTAGDSVPVSVVFVAVGGTVTSGGLYTAGSTAGTFRVIATSGALADTSMVTVIRTLGSGSGSGIPYGAFSLLRQGTGSTPFTTSLDGYGAGDIVARLSETRARGLKVFMNMTGGSHTNYLTNGVFDRAKWDAKMNTFNTPAIKAAVAAAVADGTIIGNSVMDEPHVVGGGDGNTWGPAGTMTKARVDSLCGYVKAIFPTLPVGVVHRHDIFDTSHSYQVCEFIVSQYSDRMGSVTAFRDAGLAYARRDGIAIAFSMNILNGGTQDRDGSWDCPLTTTGGQGLAAPNCRMTAQQVRDYGLVLGPAGCAMLMWKYDSGFMANAANQQAFTDVANRLASTPAKPCTRP